MELKREWPPLELWSSIGLDERAKKYKGSESVEKSRWEEEPTKRE